MLEKKKKRGRYESRETHGAKSFKIAAGFTSAEIKAALYRLCSAVADLYSEVFSRHTSPLLSFHLFFFIAGQWRVRSELCWSHNG